MKKKISSPILEFPGNARAVIEPRAARGVSESLAARCVLCFFPEVIERARRKKELVLQHKLPGEGDPLKIYRYRSGRHAITVCRPGLTAPFAAATLESLIALGCRQFIACGGAGVLDGQIPPGRVILPSSALRDEGLSYHYLKPARTVRPHSKALAALRTVCRQGQIPYLSGRTWTTDAFYRETPAQIRRRRAEACLCVEMEAAAFFAVARFRKVAFAQVLYAGDDVSGKTWKPRAWRKQFQVREQLFRLSLDAVSRI